jgi:hypothetical protein
MIEDIYKLERSTPWKYQISYAFDVILSTYFSYALFVSQILKWKFYAGYAAIPGISTLGSQTSRTVPEISTQPLNF